MIELTLDLDCGHKMTFVIPKEMNESEERRMRHTIITLVREHAYIEMMDNFDRTVHSN